MCRWSEALLLVLMLACASLPALGRCEVAEPEVACPQERAPEDFAYLLAREGESSACGAEPAE